MQMLELSVAAPQVVAHRMARLNDGKELYRMGAEKILAFSEAWMAMAAGGFGPDTLAKGLEPFRRRAVANARRLRRARRR